MDRNERIVGQLTLHLDQESIQRLGELAGQKSITAGELIEHFIHDLTHGPYSNGSDERMKAEDWMQRCDFYQFPTNSLLKYLVENEIPADRFLAVWRELQTEIEDKEWREDLEEEYRYYISDFLEDSGRSLNMDEEIELVYKWQKSQDQLLRKMGETGYLESEKRSFSQHPISREKLEEMTFLRKPSLVFMAWLDPDGKARKGEWRIFRHGWFYNGLDMDCLADYGKQIIAFDDEPRWEADEGFFFSGGVDSNQRSDLSETLKRGESDEESNERVSGPA